MIGKEKTICQLLQAAKKCQLSVRSTLSCADPTTTFYLWPLTQTQTLNSQLLVNLINCSGLTISSPGSQYPSCSMPALEPLQPTVRVSTTRPSFTARLNCLAVSFGCMPNTRLRYLHSRKWRCN